MKNFLSALAITAALFSCSQAEFDETTPCLEEFAPALEQFPQAWRLVKMTSMRAQSEIRGGEMAWQELIELNSDNTFVKTRKRGSTTEKAKGTFSFDGSVSNNTVLLTLIYSSGKDIVNRDCTGQSSTETYSFFTKCKMVFTAGLACDRPGLEYERQIQMDSAEGE